MHCCNKSIARNHRALSCDDCDSRCHIKCGCVTPSQYTSLKQVKLLLNEGLFDILAISETKVDSTYDSTLLQHPCYRIMRKDRKKAVYIRNGVSAYRRLKLEPPNMESICIDVKGHNNSRFFVLACYRSPTKNKAEIFCHQYTLQLSHCLTSEMNFSLLAISTLICMSMAILRQILS